VRIRIDDTVVGPESARIIRFQRRLQLRTGFLERSTLWQLHDGRQLEVVAQRVVSSTAAAFAIRLIVRALNFQALVTLSSELTPGRAQPRQTDDPRYGVPEELGLVVLARDADATGQAILQRTRRTGQLVACAQVNEWLADEGTAGPPCCTEESVAQALSVYLPMGASAGLNKYVAYAWTDALEPDQSEMETCRRTVLQAARVEATRQARIGFEAAVSARADELTSFWDKAHIEIEEMNAVERALRFNLFHLYQSAGRGPRSSAAAKGLTGEGYEGHYFWDTEAFILPVFVLTCPERARGLLEYRHHTLPEARHHAQELNHGRGALFPWRTISGNECSSHYPTGSAQYHINSAIGTAVWLYYSATQDHDFLIEMGAELLFETARIWLEVGRHNPQRNNLFCICGVTGPDEYSVLVDNNFYTNLTAQQHLLCAVAAAELLCRESPAAFASLATRIGVTTAEVERWRVAANSMYLPYDSELQVHAQDDSFLRRPLWDFAKPRTPGQPLLMHYHPLTLFRHQVCKQGDVILAMIHAGRAIDVSSKRRTFDHYERLTVHDSGLSACSFSILAAEIGYLQKAYKYFTDTTFIDLSEATTNTDHGVHMAAIAGSWLALVWGFGGLRCHDGSLHFQPNLPPAWTGYQFSLLWRGSRLRVHVDANQVCYELRDGPAITIRHHAQLLELHPDRAMTVTRHAETRHEPEFST
jgi:alpha,alpha-trehalose phosphorylase